MEQKIREMREAMSPKERSRWITDRLQDARLQFERQGFTMEDIGGIMLALGAAFLGASMDKKKAAQLVAGFAIRLSDEAIQEPTAEESTPEVGGYLN